MANFFSLYNGNLTDASVYGYSLSSAEVMTGVSGVSLGIVDAYGPIFTGDGSTISAVAVHLSARQANNTTDSLILKLSATGKSVQTEYYPISNFTSYNGSNNLLATYPLNWQILKLSAGYVVSNLSSARISLAATTSGVISLIGVSANNNFDKAILTNNVILTGSFTNNNVTFSSASPFGIGNDSSMKFNGTNSSLTLDGSVGTYINNALSFGTRDFTAELFVYFNSINAANDYLLCWGDGIAGGSTPKKCTSFILAYVVNKMVFNWYDGTTDNSWIGTVSAITPNTWNHLAITRSSGTMYFWVNGNQAGSNSSQGASNIGTPALGQTTFRIGGGATSGPGAGTTYYSNCYLSNIRIVKGIALYTSNFIVPTSPLYLINTSFSIQNPYYTSSNYAYTLPFDNTHLGGAIKLSATEVCTIIADNTYLGNLYIHNQGVLTFPLTSSKTLTLNGSAGLQITSDGTLNIGTSSSVIPLSTTHIINLSNTQIDVHNGGNLNVYGYPKLFTTNLVNDTVSGSRTFTITDNVSSIWKIGDTLTFKPNLTYRTGFDTLTLSSFTGNNTFTTTSASLFTHTGSATYANIAGVYNLNRNVIIQGLNLTQRGTIRTIDAAKTIINYASLSNFGINATNKTGFVFGNNLSGSTTLSGIVINSDNTSTVNNIAPLTGRTFRNVIISNNIFNKSNIIAVSSLSVNNINLSNNYILSSGGIALQMNNLSGSINMSNNTTIGSLSYGTYLANNTLTGTYGANNFNSSAQGMYVSGTNTGTIVGGGLNSAKEGVYVDASTGSLSGATFQNILANNNTSVGFKFSGNNLNYLTPVVLNINGLAANTNSDSGFEAYNITGNISGLVANNNYVNGIKTSIGNGPTIFDGISSVIATSISSIPLTLNGTSLSSASPFGIGIDGSIKFNGSSDYLKAPLNQLNFTTDFTVESWVYLNTMPTTDTWATTWSYTMVLIGKGTASLPDGFDCIIGQTKLMVQNNDTQYSAPSAHGMTIGNWYHLAYVRIGSTMYFYVNGISKGSITFISGALGNGTDTFIGSETGQGAYFNGYMSNLRYINGIGLYTTNFTPPTDPISRYGNSSVLNATYYQLSSILGTPSLTSYANTALNILSGYNYSQTVIKNSLLSATSIDPSLSASVALSINSTNFSQFSVENSIISAATPLQLITSRNLLEGSYLFNNSILGATPLGASGITNIYQPYTIKNTGFAFTNLNKIVGNNVSYYAHGSIYLDSTTFADTAASERLVPNTTTAKLKSASKFVVLNKGDYTSVITYVRKSTSSGGDNSDYNGSSPRLILKRNPSMGINNDIVLATLNYYSTAFEKLNGSTPVVSDNGVLEFYVDCDGTQGWINVDSWSAS